MERQVINLISIFILIRNLGSTQEFQSNFLKHLISHRKTSHREAFLVIDNVSCYGSLKNIRNVINIEIMILPLKTSSQLQHLDLGIIASS